MLLRLLTGATLSLCCSLPAAAAGADEDPRVVPAEGKGFHARLAAVDAEWRITFRSGQQRRVMPAEDVVSWGRFAEPLQTEQVVLADGGLIVAGVLGTDEASLVADSTLFGPLKLPLDAVAGVVLLPPADRQDRDRLLDRISGASGDSDRVLLTNGDELTGRLESIGDDAVRLETDVGSVRIELPRLRAVVFNPGLLRRPPEKGPRAFAGFSDGSRLVADELIVADESLEITTLGGLTLKTGAEDIVGLQPLGGRAVYLSDMPAAGFRHVPYLDLTWPPSADGGTWPYRTDRNVTGGLLRADGSLYLKGLGVHSAARLTYVLDGGYREFQSELAIDDSTAGGGSVRFRVYVDGQSKYTTDVVRGGAAPVPVAVDVSGAGRLDLIVDFADRAGVLDHADWLNARVVQ